MQVDDQEKENEIDDQVQEMQVDDQVHEVQEMQADDQVELSPWEKECKKKEKQNTEQRGKKKEENTKVMTEQVVRIVQDGERKGRIPAYFIFVWIKDEMKAWCFGLFLEFFNLLDIFSQ